MWDDETLGYMTMMGWDMLGAGPMAAPMRPGVLNPNALRLMAQRGLPQRMPMPMRPPMQMMPPMGPGGFMPMGLPLQGPPGWRTPQLAPGVMAPFEGLVPLQLIPDLNGGILTAAFPTITFTGRPQKPFRGQRVVATIDRSAGAGAVQPRIIGGITVGTDLQAVSRGNTSLAIFQTTAFGVELVLTPSGPGIDIVIPVSSPVAVPAGESVTISIEILGRYIAG